mmetsp:Transcript_37883/g.81620  ORF Transcript_37883/g.81620 Transcript_37883/m.81620 type:complete len:169 (-) Transcript_37883:18-524(-)
MDSMEEAFAGVEHAAGQVVADIRKAFVDAQSGKNVFQLAKDQAVAFAAAVDWREPWLASLLALHASLLLLVIFTRRHTTAQACLFVALGACIYCAKYANAWCAANWQQFASQPYFDEQGLFISVVLSAPFLIINIIILINHLIVLSGLIVRAKRAELKYKARSKKKEN